MLNLFLDLVILFSDKVLPYLGSMLLCRGVRPLLIPDVSEHVFKLVQEHLVLNFKGVSPLYFRLRDHRLSYPPKWPIALVSVMVLLYDRLVLDVAVAELRVSCAAATASLGHLEGCLVHVVLRLLVVNLPPYVFVPPLPGVPV